MLVGIERRLERMNRGVRPTFLDRLGPGIPIIRIVVNDPDLHPSLRRRLRAFGARIVVTFFKASSRSGMIHVETYTLISLLMNSSTSLLRPLTVFDQPGTPEGGLVGL